MAIRLSRGLDLIGGKGMKAGRSFESARQKAARYQSEIAKSNARNSAFGKIESDKIPEVYSRKNGQRIAPGESDRLYQGATNPGKHAAQQARMEEQRKLKQRLQQKHGSSLGNSSAGRTSQNLSFSATGQQGLDKLRYMESRGAKPNEEMRRNALSGDMRRNFSEQGGINRVGVSALRGAVVGGVAGGSIESMQGGDFWDGAKSGAFYGATGMAAARGARQAVGAQAYRGKDGIMGTMKMNKEAYGVGVKDLMLNQQNVGRAKDVMSRTRKK